MDDIKEIINPVSSELEKFETELKDLVKKYDNFLTDILVNFLFSSPKRVRPIFIFLFSKILNIKNENVMKIALASEIIHNASLVHDDVIDNELTRRNTETFYKEFGSKIAVLEGDMLLSIALKILSETSLEILKIYSNNILKTINGEIEQCSISGVVPDIETYLDKTFNKTGRIFLCGLESLFTLDSVNENEKNALASFMNNYSLAFQIKNDIDNILYKNLSDINNGNYTLPVIYFCSKNSIKEFNTEQINNFLNDKEIYVKMAYDKVLEYKNNAINKLNVFSESEYKKSLLELAECTLRSCC